MDHASQAQQRWVAAAQLALPASQRPAAQASPGSCVARSQILDALAQIESDSVHASPQVSPRGRAQIPTASTVGAALGGHTLAAGLELSAGDATITIGVARQLARTTTTRAPGLPLDNPFPGGVAPANLGQREASIDLVGIGLELAAP